MAKVKQPLLSLDARRKLGDEIVYGHRQKANIVQARPRPKDARSAGQLSWRHMFLKVVALWQALSAAEKEAWESLARSRHMTGYACFVSQALKPNPGIYLPLQGGTMQGVIDMGGFAITELPAPTGAKYATRRSYVIARIAADILTHKGDTSAHHARYSDAEALAAAEAGGLSKVIWKDADSVVLSDLNRVAALNWTDLDLTASTSANAVAAYLVLQITVDVAPAGSWTQLQVRKNGTTPSYMPTVFINSTFPNISVNQVHAICGLDGGQVLEYRIISANWAGGRIDSFISVLGYIE